MTMQVSALLEGTLVIYLLYLSRTCRYSDFAVTDAILVCLKLSENYHTGIYYYSTCFVYADISRQSE